MQKTATFTAQFPTPAISQDSPGANLRHEALRTLDQLELPTTKWETWKYTSLRPITNLDLKPAAAASDRLQSADGFRIPEFDAQLLVFVNGAFVPQLSDAVDDDALDIAPIDMLEGAQREIFEAHFGQLVPADEDVFTALNTAHAAQGLLVRVKRGKQAARPLHVVNIDWVDSPSAVISRNIFVVEANAEAKIVESYHSLGDGSCFRNQVNELFVAENAGLEYVKIETHGRDAHLLDRTEVRQSDDSRARLLTFTTGGAWTRNHLRFHLHGQNIESRLNGLYLLDGEQFCDNHTYVDHREPHGFSDELYKGILADRATGVFNGKIHVFPDAQKTNAFQSCRNILLSDGASINAKPQLEIYADDVKCSHGATTGRVDADALFYLRARGIPLEKAQQLMVQAFAGEALEVTTMEAVQDYLVDVIARRFD